MLDHLNAARREAQRAMSNRAEPRLALVSSYDPSSYSVKVLVQPEGYETGWIPLGVHAAGNQFGVFMPPSPGDQMVIVPVEGASGSAVAVASIYSVEDRAEVEQIGGCPSGEYRIVSKTGARIRLLGDGTIEIYQAEGVKLTLNPDGSVDLNAPTLRIGGEGGNFLRLLDERFWAWATTHVHPQVGPPLAPPTLDASATTNLTGA